MAGSFATISPDRRRRLVVMLKEPGPGRVKTRLGREIGMVEAAWWYRHQTRALLARISDRRWETILAVSPDRAGLASRVWPHHLPRLAQGPGDLGQRMARLFNMLPPGPALVIGSDIPGITRAIINQSFQTIATEEAIFGPAPDGGYWLIGLKRNRPAPPGFLKGVRWSTRNALADSLRTVKGCRIAMAATLSDVDTVADIERGGRPAM